MLNGADIKSSFSCFDFVWSILVLFHTFQKVHCSCLVMLSASFMIFCIKMYLVTSYFHFNHISFHQKLQRFFYVFVYIHFSITLFTDNFEGSSLSIICTVISGTLVLGTWKDIIELFVNKLMYICLFVYNNHILWIRLMKCKYGKQGKSIRPKSDLRKMVWKIETDIWTGITHWIELLRGCGYLVKMCNLWRQNLSRYN